MKDRPFGSLGRLRGSSANQFMNDVIYETKYCLNCLVLFLFFSFRNALSSICRILSLLTPINSPISCNVFILPSSIPNLHLMTWFSLGLRLSRTLSRSFFINSFISRSSAVSASGSAVTSWGIWCTKFSANQASWKMQRWLQKFKQKLQGQEYIRENITDRKFKIHVKPHLLVKRSWCFWS